MPACFIERPFDKEGGYIFPQFAREPKCGFKILDHRLALLRTVQQACPPAKNSCLKSSALAFRRPPLPSTIFPLNFGHPLRKTARLHANRNRNIYLDWLFDVASTQPYP